MKKAFTLVEMLVVIGIISLLMGASIVGYNSAVEKAEKAKAFELLSNVKTALENYYTQNNSTWPTDLKNGADRGLLDEDAVYMLAKKGYYPLNIDDGHLAGYDRFGIVTPWATNVIKTRGKGVTKSTKVGSVALEKHIIHYAIAEEDGNGIVEIPASSGGKSVRVRAVACVWCCPKNGSNRWEDQIKSWDPGKELK